MNLRTIATALLSLTAGAALVLTQQPPSSRTNPYSHDDATADEPYASADSRSAGTIRLEPNVVVQPSDASVTVQFAPLTVNIQPLLTFISRSPDGAPTVFVSALEREIPRLAVKSWDRPSDRAVRLRYEFAALSSASLRVETAADNAIAIESFNTVYSGKVFSHLNSFCDFEVRGHSRLTLEFSPCAGVPIDVLPFDYPFGRPARFAFVTAEREFRVVEATSGEKGPFHDLARGRLQADEALTITLQNLGRPVMRITLGDWASQADTTLSPTAGWGVPVNAIEFSLSNDSPAAPASIFVTLAATSVGRGWDCVAHNTGVYRNRMHLQAVPAPAQ